MADSLPKEEAFAYTALIRDIFTEAISVKYAVFRNPTEEEIAQAKENIISYGERGMVYGRKAEARSLPTYSSFPKNQCRNY